MKNFNQTNLERAKSEIIIKVANMLMEIDNETLDKVDTTCDSIKNTINELNDFNPKWGTELNAILNMRMN